MVSFLSSPTTAQLSRLFSFLSKVLVSSQSSSAPLSYARDTRFSLMPSELVLSFPPLKFGTVKRSPRDTPADVAQSALKNFILINDLFKNLCLLQAS